MILIVVLIASYVSVLEEEMQEHEQSEHREQSDQ